MRVSIRRARGNGPWDNDLHEIETAYLKDGEFLVGEVDDRVVAMGAFKRLDAETGEIRRIRVEPSEQRRGYGRMILEALEARALGLGMNHLQLDTTAKQQAALGLFRDFGYREVRREAFIDSEQIYFEKDL